MKNRNRNKAARVARITRAIERIEKRQPGSAAAVKESAERMLAELKRGLARPKK